MMNRLFCALLLSILISPAKAQATCSPPALGHPCATGGIAIQGSLDPEPNLGIGNPVHLATGNKHQQEVDLPGYAANPLLQLMRHYNSLDPRYGPFGRGWSLSYDTRLYVVAERVQIVQADGSRIHFGKLASGDAQGPIYRNRHGQLHRQTEQWLWVWPDGRQLRFDAAGRLTRIAAPKQRNFATSLQPTLPALDVIDIVRHSQSGPLQGAIAQVVAAGPGEMAYRLTFHYRIQDGRAYVKAIDTPVGRFTYHYEGTAGPTTDKTGVPDRLVHVQRPDGYKRLYTYEPSAQSGDASLITGVSLADPKGRRLPLHSWAYDAYGRAIASKRLYPGGSQTYAMRINYIRTASENQPGLTEVTNTQGLRTRFKFTVREGRYSLLKVDGAPCAACPALGAWDSAHNGFPRWNRPGLTASTTEGLQQLYPGAAGWPALRMDYDRHGLRTAWHSSLTGTETVQFDKVGRPLRRVFANGNQWHYAYDRLGRPRILTTHNTESTQSTRLYWRQSKLTRIQHPHEEEIRHYDQNGRLAVRQVHRRPAAHGGPTAYTDRFEYDSQDRLHVHHLPEGGSMHYEYSAAGRLLGIRWHDALGQTQNVIQAQADQAGYEFGNGLRLALHTQAGTALALSLFDGDRVVWDHFRHHDSQSRPIREHDEFPSLSLNSGWRLAYDEQSRLVVAGAPSEPRPQWHAWHEDGSALAIRIEGQTHRPTITRDASGLPKTISNYTLRYNAAHRLVQVSQGPTVVARYQHNAFGHRIHAQNAYQDSDFFYLDNRLVAEARRSTQPSSPPLRLPVTRRYVHAGHALVGIIDYTPDAPSGTLYAVHSDLMGAPRLITDAHRRMRWLAVYTPFGKAQRISGDMQLHMRLPGQIFDPETGWHDNLLRTYDPDFGHYLETDPLGPLPGTQALGYADQQPRRYIDPLGLLLFAFDGTRQDARTRSNVWLLSQHYRDGPVFYHSGPGNPHYLDLDAMMAHQAPQIIQTQWQHLLNALHSTIPGAEDPMPIDIIGYSRGAALARHFGNLVEQHVEQGLFSYADPLRGQISACVDLRFMGLFDTVAQFGLDGQLNELYDFSIAAAWGWVAHAVALHERRWTFPLLAAVHGNPDNIVEAPFIGAHGDIGGGIPVGEQSQADLHGDLSDIALNWMLWQAQIASVPWDVPAAEQRAIQNPILHDSRTALARSLYEGDRRIDRPDGRKWHGRQDRHASLGQRQREATEALIQRYENWRSNDSEAVGTIDMEGYADWLRDELGWHAPPVQATSMANHAII